MGFFAKNGCLGLYQHFTIGKPMWKYWHLANLSSKKYQIFQKWLLSAEFLGEARTSTWVFLSGYVHQYAMSNIKQNKTCGSAVIGV